LYPTGDITFKNIVLISVDGKFKDENIGRNIYRKSKKKTQNIKLKQDLGLLLKLLIERL